MNTRNEPKTIDIVEWEKTFDEEYGTVLETQLLGIVSSALYHGAYHNFGTDASHITKKLEKIVKAEIKKAVKIMALPEEDSLSESSSECGDEKCPSCRHCHNMDCESFVRPFKECWDQLLPKK